MSLYDVLNDMIAESFELLMCGWHYEDYPSVAHFIGGNSLSI